MRREHVILVAGAIAVSGLVLYLFVAVRAAPAQAQAQAEDPPPRVARAEPDVPATRTPEAKQADPEHMDDANPKRTIRSIGTGIDPLGLRRGDKGKAERDLAEQDPDRANPKMDAVMDEANKAYDTGDMEDAKTIALKVLATDPTNIRMLRIAVSSSCIDGDIAEAQKHYAQLPAVDRNQMKVRCARYGVTFTEPATDPAASRK